MIYYKLYQDNRRNAANPGGMHAPQPDRCTTLKTWPSTWPPTTLPSRRVSSTEY